MVRYNNDLDNYESYYHHHEEHDTYDSPKHAQSERRPQPPPPTRASRRDVDDSHLFHREHVMPAAGHALAGAVGSAIANLATYPLDVVSTRLKVQRHAMAQRLEREELQRRHKGKSKKKEKTRRSSTSSSSSAVEEEPVGIFNVTQEQAKGYHKYETSTVVESWEYEYEDEELYSGHFDAVQKIYEKEGIRGFYHGVGWDTVGTAASGFWYFMAYTLLRKQRLHILAYHGKHTQTLPVMEELGIGIAASALSKLVSTPFSNIVTRKQTAAMLYPGMRPPSFDDIYHDIMREKGVTGFWSGYTASLLLTFNPSITFLLYEYAKPHVTAHKGGSLDKMDIFLLAAFCKAAATTLTYPMNVIRIRSQMDDGADEWDGIIDTSTSGVKDIHVSKRRPSKNKIDTHYKRAVKRASGIVGLLSEIVKREGITALYIGLGGTLAKGFISHGVTMMIKENVHRFIIKLYFFVLDAYQRSEYGSFREAALGRTLEGVRKTSHAVGSATRKVETAKERASHIGERVKEKAYLGHTHGQSHSHSNNHRGSTSRDRFIESRTVREDGRSFRSGREEEQEMFEERFAAAPRERSERTIIHEEHITEELPRESREATYGEERLAAERAERLEREVSRGRQTTREEHIRTTTAVRPQPAQRINASTGVNVSAGTLVGAPPVPLAKQTERVSQWRDRVAEETATAAAAAIVKPENAVTTRHEGLEGAHGEHIDRTITTRETTFGNDVTSSGHAHHHRHRSHHRGVINSREPSMASGQTYRSAGGRTSLLVHPPSSYRENVTGEWTEDGRFVNTSSHSRLTGGRPLMGGGDIGVNSEVRTFDTKDTKVWK